MSYAPSPIVHLQLGKQAQPSLDHSVCLLSENHLEKAVCVFISTKMLGRLLHVFLLIAHPLVSIKHEMAVHNESTEMVISGNKEQKETSNAMITMMYFVVIVLPLCCHKQTSPHTQTIDAWIGVFFFVLYFFFIVTPGERDDDV